MPFRAVQGAQIPGVGFPWENLSSPNGTYLSQLVLFKRLDRHSGAGRNPGKRPPLVRLDPGLRRDDGGFEP